MNSFRFFVRFLRWHMGHTLPMIIHHSSTYPEFPRKSAFHRYLDNLYIYIRDGAPCPAYDAFGLDIKGARLNNYISNYRWVSFLYRKLSAVGLRNVTVYDKITFDGDSPVHLLTDKYCFWSFLERHNIPVVPVLAHTVGGKLYDYTPKDKPLASMSGLFVKPANGLCGKSCSILSSKDGHFFCGDQPRELGDFIGQSQDYIFQPVIENHADIKALNPTTLNTLRIVTCRTKDGKYALWNPGMLRIGRSHGVVDNFAQGGIGVGIDEKGHLKRYGYTHDKTLNYSKLERHPDTQLLFSGREIPFYQEAVALALNAHKLFPGLQTVGWDVAVTSEGPFLVEGNQDWDIEMLQVVHHEGFVPRFRDIYGNL